MKWGKSSRGLKAIQASEHEEQAALVSWAYLNRRKHPELAMLFAIPNQGAARLKNLQTEGVMKGVPDLFLAVPRTIYPVGELPRGWHGLFIELKRKKGGKLSFEQIQWLNALTEQGYLAEVAYGFEEARDKIHRYLGFENGCCG